MARHPIGDRTGEGSAAHPIGRCQTCRVTDPDPDVAPDTDGRDLAALAEATAGLVVALDGIDEQDRGLATPCADWDLGALVDHVTGGNWFTLSILAGLRATEAMEATMARFGSGPADGDAATRSATDQLDAFEQDGALDRTCHHMAGDLTGRQVLRLRVHDLIVHTWDIGQARHPPASVPERLADWGRGELRRGDSLMAKHFDIPETSRPSPPSGDASSAYLLAFGR